MSNFSLSSRWILSCVPVVLSILPELFNFHVDLSIFTGISNLLGESQFAFHYSAPESDISHVSPYSLHHCALRNLHLAVPFPGVKYSLLCSYLIHRQYDTAIPLHRLLPTSYLSATVTNNSLYFFLFFL